MIRTKNSISNNTDSLVQHNTTADIESRYLSAYDTPNFGVAKSIINKTNNYVENSDENERNNLNNNFNVKFSGFVKPEKIDEREKYLTAKYPNHQMALIKKRLKVEFWIDDQLKNLYSINLKKKKFKIKICKNFSFKFKDENTNQDYDICPDDLVDTLLDMDTDNERRLYVIVSQILHLENFAINNFFLNLNLKKRKYIS